MSIAEAIVIAADLRDIHRGVGRYQWDSDGMAAPLYTNGEYDHAVTTLIEHARATLVLPAPAPTLIDPANPPTA